MTKSYKSFRISIPRPQQERWKIRSKIGWAKIATSRWFRRHIVRKVENVQLLQGPLSWKWRVRISPKLMHFYSEAWANGLSKKIKNWLDCKKIMAVFQTRNPLKNVHGTVNVQIHNLSTPWRICPKGSRFLFQEISTNVKNIEPKVVEPKFILCRSFRIDSSCIHTNCDLHTKYYLDISVYNFLQNFRISIVEYRQIGRARYAKIDRVAKKLWQNFQLGIHWKTVKWP